MTQHKKEIPKWLARIQEQSWEPEILISGIVLFALFQLPKQFEHFGAYIIKFSNPIISNGTIDESLIEAMKIGVYWLIIGFSTHLAFRCIWVAFVGLSYAYPEGIKKENLPYSKSYLKLINADLNFIDIIKRLERLCSSLFALGFLLFMIVFGVLTCLIFLTLIVLTLAKVFPEFTGFHYLDNIISILFIVYIFDFVTLGLIRRVPYLSKVYYPFYRLLSFLTLSFLYRDVLYHFISNHRKWKVFLFILIFSTISIFWGIAMRNSYGAQQLIELSAIKTQAKQIDNEHYQNLATAEFIDKIQIENDVVTNGVLKAFVCHAPVVEMFWLKDSCTINGEKIAISAKLSDSVKLSCLNNFYSLQVDDSLFTSDYLFTIHPKTEQPGLMAYLDIDYLDRGMHQLILHYQNPNSTNDSISTVQVSTVKFFKN